MRRGSLPRNATMLAIDPGRCSIRFASCRLPAQKRFAFIASCLPDYGRYGGSAASANGDNQNQEPEKTASEPRTSIHKMPRQAGSLRRC